MVPRHQNSHYALQLIAIEHVFVKALAAHRTDTLAAKAAFGRTKLTGVPEQWWLAS